MKVKNNWSDITISEYQEIVNVEGESELQKVVNIISILSDTDIDQIRRAPLHQFYEWSDAIKFIQTPPDADFNRTFFIDSVEYGFIPDLNYVSTGEWLDCENWKNDPINNMHLFAALLFRPITNRTESDYEIEEHQTKGFIDRAALFSHRLSVSKVYGAQIFFLIFAVEFMEISAAYLTEPVKQPNKKKKTTKTKTTRPATKKRKKNSSNELGAGTI